MIYDQLNIDRQKIAEQAEALLQEMSLQEKVYLLNGNMDFLRNAFRYRNPYNPVPIKTNGCERLGIPPIAFTDGPRGIVMGKSTCFPVSMARGASFDRDLERRVGDVIGKEGRAQGANYFAGVCINLLRHPAWGRAQETYGEDPYHVGEMGKSLTQAVQGHNMMACLKHYALNNIENTRFKVNVKVADRVLHEVYLPHFKKSVDAGAASLMGAYNRFNGDHASESRKLLTDILRDQWGFEGFTSSDFIFAIRDGKKAIEAGMDVEMPAAIRYHRHLIKLVKDGKLDESVIDLSALRVIKTVLAFSQRPEKHSYDGSMVASAEHVALAREVAEKSIVLMKNDSQVLPLTKSVRRVLVAGDLAARRNTGDYGSSRIVPRHVITHLQGLQKFLGTSCEVIHCGDSDLANATREAGNVDAVLIFVGCDAHDEGEYLVPDEEVDYSLLAQGYFNNRQPIKGLLGRIALKLARQKMAASQEEGKGSGGDRHDLGLKAKHLAMIRAVAGLNPNTVVNLVGGSMIMCSEWDSLVPAILHNWYPGMEGGAALARILFGEVNPSGKLPFSVPENVADLPYFSTTDSEIEYGLYHGYTLLDKKGVEPLYPFGFGLSYTRFTLGNHRVSRVEEHICVSVDVANTGSVGGEEVIQVYVGCSNSIVERQKKLLKGFEKVPVAAGQSKTVAIAIPLDELQYYDEDTRSFVFEAADYQIYVGTSSSERDLVELPITISNPFRGAEPNRFQ